MTLGEWVLILVLVEHTLGAEEIGSLTALKCLNPCFSGTYSRSVAAEAARTAQAGLNPCFSGTYSRRWQICRNGLRLRVLILVLVEHTLGGQGLSYCGQSHGVLILVLVEHTLGGHPIRPAKST